MVGEKLRFPTGCHDESSKYSGGLAKLGQDVNLKPQFRAFFRAI